MTYSLEFPWMRCPVIPLVSARDSVIHELVPDRLPSLPGVVRTLDQLPVPPRRLLGMHPIRVRRRLLPVITLPAGEVRPAHLPLVTLGIGFEHESALPRAFQYTYLTHA